VSEPRVLVLDEPSAVLAGADLDALFAVIRRLQARGVLVVYVSHRLAEVLELATRIVVVKDGRVVATTTPDATDEGSLIRLMAGRTLDRIYPERRPAPGGPLLRVDGLGRTGEFDGVSFTLRAGEIVGLFGLVGSGRTELAACVFGATAILNAYAGVPIALVIFVLLVVGFDLILRRTRYGRNIFAVGGNIEAARRAGISVTAIRISVFVLASTLAAIGGILAASRAYSVGQSSGSNDTLLLAIAAAVIGGTSLFGGRGSTDSALLGALVLGSIQSGMLLLSLDTSVRFMITAGVLVGAVVLDSLSRRGRRSSGRE
jgi:energy-coupling factor transporter ATP-binding protein EcfA2